MDSLRERVERMLNENKHELVRCWIFESFIAQTQFLPAPVFSPSHFRGLLLAQGWEPQSRTSGNAKFGRYLCEDVTWTFSRELLR